MTGKPAVSDQDLQEQLSRGGLGYVTIGDGTMALAREWSASARKVRASVEETIMPATGPATVFAHTNGPAPKRGDQ